MGPVALTGSLHLDTAVASPPIPALLTVLVVAGFGVQAAWLVTAAALDSRHPRHLAGGLLVVVAAWSAAIHLAYSFGRVPVGAVRVAAWAVAAVGAVGIVRFAPGAVRAARALVPRPLGVAGAVALVSAAALAASALGPATDADSLDYHLGVPLDWLAAGQATDRVGWFTSRLAGLGEMPGLLGLAGGTDGVGAGLQAVGFLLVVAIVVHAANGATNARLAMLLVACCPVFGFLVPNQKPQVFPALASVAAVAWLLERDDARRPAEVALLLAGLGFAVGCKLTFALTALPVAVCLAWVGLAGARTRQAAAVGLFALALLAGLPAVRRFRQTGDPAWPFLAARAAGAEPGTVGFAAALREGDVERSAIGLVRLAMRLVVPPGPGAFQTTLGLGVLAVVALGRGLGGAGWRVVGLAAGTSVLFVGLGPWAPRFFLEPYLWIALAVTGGDWSPRKLWLERGLAVQGALCAAFFVPFSAFLLAGATTGPLRRAVLSRTAIGWEAARWLDTVLPADAVVLTNLRSRSLLPRRFVVAEPAKYLPRAEAEEVVRRLASGGGATHAAHEVGPDGRPVDFADPLLGDIVAGPVELAWRTRNPFNRGEARRLAVFRIQVTRAGGLPPRPATGSGCSRSCAKRDVGPRVAPTSIGPHPDTGYDPHSGARLGASPARRDLEENPGTTGNGRPRRQPGRRGGGGRRVLPGPVPGREGGVSLREDGRGGRHAADRLLRAAGRATAPLGGAGLAGAGAGEG